MLAGKIYSGRFVTCMLRNRCKLKARIPTTGGIWLVFNSLSYFLIDIISFSTDRIFFIALDGLMPWGEIEQHGQSDHTRDCGSRKYSKFGMIEQQGISE